MLDILIGFFAQPQICGVSRIAARYDCQRVGLAKRRQSSLEQSVVEGEGRLFC